MMGDSCILHEHRSLVVLQQVPLRPVSRGGPTGGPAVPVCVNSAALIFELLRRIEGFAAGRRYDTARQVINALPPRLREIYPGAERVVAYKIWLWYGDAYLRGVLEDLIRTWHPDGRPRLPDWPSADDLASVAGWPARLRRKLAEL